MIPDPKPALRKAEDAIRRALDGTMWDYVHGQILRAQKALQEAMNEHCWDSRIPNDDE